MSIRIQIQVDRWQSSMVMLYGCMHEETQHNCNIETSYASIGIAFLENMRRLPATVIFLIKLTVIAILADISKLYSYVKLCRCIHDWRDHLQQQYCNMQYCNIVPPNTIFGHFSIHMDTPLQCHYVWEYTWENHSQLWLNIWGDHLQLSNRALLLPA